MREKFEQQLKELHSQMTEMGAMCEDVISKTSELLKYGDPELAKDIRNKEVVIDQQEREIETLCLKLLLTQQPVATDLRKVSAALKMITDMERIGDQAADIAEIVETSKLQVQEEKIKLTQMANISIEMVIQSIDAYIKNDMEIAQQVIGKDDVIDDLFLEVREEIVQEMQTSEINMSSSLDMLMIAKYYERIGDHATNIAEWVEFSITGIHRDMDQMG